VQGVERGVPGRVPEHLAGTGNTGGDAAERVLAGDLGVPRPCPAGELVPADEVQDRFTAEPPRHAGRQASLRHRLLSGHMEAASDRRRPGQRELEGLRHVVSVHVMQDAEPVIGQRERSTRRQVSPRGGGEVSRRGDDRPARSADVTRVQHHGRDTARLGLPVQQCLDLSLAPAVIAISGAGLVLSHRHPQRGTVDPDGSAVHQQRARRAQRLDELPRRSGGEADEVDHRLRAQRRHPGAEHSCRVFCLPVSGDPGHRVPLRAAAVRAAGAAADRDHLMAAIYQPRHQVRADVPGRPDDNHTAHPRPVPSCASPRPCHPRTGPEHSRRIRLRAMPMSRAWRRLAGRFPRPPVPAAFASARAPRSPAVRPGRSRGGRRPGHAGLSAPPGRSRRRLAG
jgi:hypothetical protein